MMESLNQMSVLLTDLGASLKWITVTFKIWGLSMVGSSNLMFALLTDLAISTKWITVP